MAYRLDPELPTPIELRRLLREQVDAAVDLLRGVEPPDGDRLHDARLCVKKARSVVRLARGDLGRAVARQANAELREVNRSLAEARDEDSMGECLARLAAAATDEAETGALDGVRRVVTGDGAVGDAPATLSRSTAHGAALVLARVATWIDQVPPRREGWAALAPGFGREYRRGRRSYLELGEDPSVDALHHWRARAKSFDHHQRILRGLWPEAQKPLRQAATDLAKLLGDDHDLAVLRDGLTSDRWPVRPIDRDVVVSMIDAERLRLQVEARELGGFLYADEPGAWVARHGAWWGHRLTCSGGPRPA
ncbi:MAG: CHAD domain-containing protein [Actinobacteria bacterium]|nr:CHAD domain-containing protein [Actinomycetota bacterium]